MKRYKRIDFKQLEGATHKQIAAVMPPGVNFDGSPLYEFTRDPRWSLFPQTLRHAMLAHMIIRRSGIDKRKRSLKVLDCAAGYAELFHWLKKAMFAPGSRLDYTGVDCDPRKAANVGYRWQSIKPQTRRQIRYLLCDIRWQLPATIGSLAPFDFVISSETIEHFTKREGVALMRELFRLTKPGGTLIFTIPIPPKTCTHDQRFHLYEWPEDELRSFLEGEQNIEIEDWRYMKPTLADCKEAFSKLEIERALELVPGDLLRSVLAGFMQTGNINVPILRRV